MLRLAATEQQLKAICQAAPPNPDPLGLRFRLAPDADFESVTLLVKGRGTEITQSHILRHDGHEYVLDDPVHKLESLENVVADFYVRLEIDGLQGPLRRVAAPDTGLPLELGGTRLYATINGNLSIDRRR